MKLLLLLSALLLCSSYGVAQEIHSEIVEVPLSDGEMVLAKIQTPDTTVKTIVLAVHGTGPGTHLEHRGKFSVYDLEAKGFCEQGVAFCSYDRRGVTVGTEPPFFHQIDSLKYSKYGPALETKDVESIVKAL